MLGAGSVGCRPWEHGFWPEDPLEMGAYPHPPPLLCLEATSLPDLLFLRKPNNFQDKKLLDLTLIQK